jgi:hypothetical protein
LTAIVEIETSGWFAVRCVFRSNWPASARPEDGHQYEERITIWRARSADEAIVKAEAEARAYAALIEEAPSEYLGFAQSYEVSDSPDQEGAEVFSLIRDSTLEASDYLDAFFDTGREHLPGHDHLGAGGS